ncbi:MAG: tRNA (adenosine(37)-N6)-dimethylallyltransferase MiaA [Crocinitomicaceae bacterium]|nr:tRNA (adenosine(37)-N6)-dimethylallyltransferase MiaA [Crocinitomicaceae bacterium]
MKPTILKKIKHLIVIEGPTASGKTSLSIELAKHFNTSILSADSRQFYKELNIGTAKPDLEEQDGIKHYFVDSHSVIDEVTSAKFEKDGLIVLNQIFKSNDVAILVGGSGMFINALCYGLDDIPTDSNIKSQIISEHEKYGTLPLLNELKEKDIKYYQEVDRNNPMRIIRAIEVIRITGKKYSELRKSKTKAANNRTFKIHKYIINHNRTQLYNRINLRVDKMIEKGLIKEVKSLIKYRKLNSLKTVGYKEIFNYLDGYNSLESTIIKIKQNTRRYAKRQLTWFRKDKSANWINFDTNKKMKEIILSDLASKFQ